MFVRSAVGMLAAMAVSTSAAAATKDRPLFKEGEVIVKFTRGARQGMMSAAATSVHAGAQVVRTMAAVGRPSVALVRFPASVPVATAVEKLRSQPGVEYAEPNYIAYIPEVDQAQSQLAAPRRGVWGTNGRATADPSEALSPAQASLMDPKAQYLSYNNDPYTGYEYGWYWISASVIWPDTAANPTIAVIDTGVDYLHPDLTGHVMKGGDWVNDDVDPMDDNGHGTHVAGIAAAAGNNTKGVIGVSKAQIYAVKVLGAQGSGSYFDIAQGINQAANNAAVKILNMSLGGPCGSTTLTAAMHTAAGKGKLIVVAMGNSNANVTGDTVCPAAYADPTFDPVTAPVTVAVGASGIPNYYGTCPGAGCYWYYNYSCRAPYTNYATWMTTIAPGTAIMSTTPDNKPFWLNRWQGVPGSYAFLNGTSMATPMVAGSASRTFSAMPAGTTAAEVKLRLTDTGSPDVDFGQGYFIDTNGDGATDTECWPTAAGFNPATTAVNVASAMKRAEVDGVALNANGALNLTGGQVKALLGITAKGFGGKVDDGYDGYYRILNVPMNSTTPYDFAVNKPGFTSGNQKFTQLSITDTCPNFVLYHSPTYCIYWYNQQISVGANVPGRYNFVTDWPYTSYEVDQYLYGPSMSPTSACSVGRFGGCGGGEFITLPFMKYLHNGGPFQGSGSVEFTEAKNPLPPQGAGTPYEIFATDYTYPGGVFANSFYLYNYDAVFRLWKGGVILNTVHAKNGDRSTHHCTIASPPGAVACNAWYVGDLTSAGVFTAKNVFGRFVPPSVDPVDGVIPYLLRPSGGASIEAVGQPKR
jgi:subtilisin family serine protease